MKLVDDPRAAARRTAIRPGLAMMMAGALLLSPALALAERYQRVVRYSLNPDAFGWASNPQEACDEIERAFNAGNGAGPGQNHQFLSRYYLAGPESCAVEYHYDNQPGEKSWSYPILASMQCPAQSTWVPGENDCISNLDETLAEAATPASCAAGDPGVGNPIYPLRGVKREVVPLGIAVGPVDLRFIYDNGPKLQQSGAQPPRLSKQVLGGALWRSTVHRGLVVQGGGRSVQVGRPTGEVSGVERGGGVDREIRVTLDPGFSWWRSTTRRGCSRRWRRPPVPLRRSRTAMHPLRPPLHRCPGC